MDLKVTAKKAGTMFTPEAMPFSLSSLFSTYASVAATMMLLRSMAAELLPDPVRSYLVSNFHYFFNLTSLAPSMNTITVEESAGITRNQVFDAAAVYLATKIDTSPNCTRFGVYKIPKQKAITAKVEKGEEIADTYKDVKLLWRFVCEEPEKEHRSHEKRFFELRFEKKHRDLVMESYLPYVLARSKAITEEKRVIRLHTRDLPGECDENFRCQEWGSIELEHPATFHKLAMNHDQKAMIVTDLERFVKRREYYKKVGKAWKRGYLLFGPPGTGKSSLIAAIANYLKFDIYDLELASVYSNSELRRLLLSTANRSILVIEDIDCNAQTKSRLRNYDYDDDDDESDYEYDHEASSSGKLTLSGLLNAIDGLWSSCGDERIIIFTTNHKDRLDPALLRPGRMDVHIHMSYCTPQGLRTLASNYHDVQSHPRFDEIDGLLEGAKVSPAEIAEELMKSEDGNSALEGVFNFVKRKSDAAIESHKSKNDEGGNEGGVEKKSGKKRKGKGRGGNKKRPKGG